MQTGRFSPPEFQGGQNHEKGHFDDIGLVMAASLAACGGGASSGSSAAAQSTPAPTPESTAAEAQDSTASAGDDGTLYGTASADIESTVSSLTAAYEALTADIATYDDYVANVDRVEAFYATVIEETRNLCIRLREYGADYVDSVLSSGLTCDEMYDELDVLYDDLYDDAGGDVYDEIYDDLMGDLYDVFYDGILKDAYDTVDYSDWADTHSNEYDFWSDAHSDIYDEWSDFHSDIYDLWSDVRGELWDDDLDRAAEKLADFRADLQSLKEESAQNRQRRQSGGVLLCARGKHSQRDRAGRTGRRYASGLQKRHGQLRDFHGGIL